MKHTYRLSLEQFERVCKASNLVLDANPDGCFAFISALDEEPSEEVINEAWRSVARELGVVWESIEPTESEDVQLVYATPLSESN